MTLLSAAYPPRGGRAASIVPSENVRDAFAYGLERAQAEGLDVANLIKLRFLYTELSDATAMNAVREEVFADGIRSTNWPASTGVVTGGRGGEAPRFECQLIFGTGGTGYRSDEVVTEWGASRPKFSHAHRSGDTIFIAGQGAYDVDGQLRGNDVDTQARGALATFEPILGAAGAGPKDIVVLTAYVARPFWPHVPRVSELITEYCAGFVDLTPVVVILPVEELAYGMHIEIEAVASVASTHTVVSAGGRPVAVVSRGFAFASARGPAEDLADVAQRALDGIGGTSDRRLITVWVPQPFDRAGIEEVLAGVLDAHAEVTIAPFPVGAAEVCVEVMEFSGE